jgi:hypothetical protein
MTVREVAAMAPFWMGILFLPSELGEMFKLYVFGASILVTLAVQLLIRWSWLMEKIANEVVARMMTDPNLRKFIEWKLKDPK